MSNLKKGIKNSSFVIAGNTISQLLNFASSIYVARFLGPKDYGVYNTVFAYSSMFTLITLNGLSNVIIRECVLDPKNKTSIINNSMGIRNIFSILAVLVSIIVLVFINYSTETKFLCAIFSLDLMFTGLDQTMSATYRSIDKFDLLTYISIGRSLMWVAIAFLVVFLGGRVLALLVSNLFVSLVFFLISFVCARKYIKVRLFSKPRLDKKQLKEGTLFSINYFFLSLSTKMDLFMLSFLGTPTEVGDYSVAFKIAYNANKLSNSVSLGFYPLFIKRFKNSGIKKKKLFEYSLKLLIPIIIISIIVSYFSTFIVTLFYGDQYIQSGKILSVTILYLGLIFIGLPYSLMLRATYNENISFIVNLVQGLLNIAFNYILYKMYGVIGIAYSTLVTFGASQVLMAFWGYNRLRSKGYIQD